MRITLIQTGKTKDNFIQKGIDEFAKRITRYVPFSIDTIPDLKNSRNMTMKEVQAAEYKQLEKRIKPDHYVILLDERGKSFNSISFAEHLNGLEGKVKHLAFIIGGAYGFAEDAYRVSNETLSLSSLTFSHQLVRLLFMEQLYRAYTILRGEPYHHA